MARAYLCCTLQHNAGWRATPLSVILCQRTSATTFFRFVHRRHTFAKLSQPAAALGTWSYYCLLVPPRLPCRVTCTFAEYPSGRFTNAHVRCALVLPISITSRCHHDAVRAAAACHQATWRSAAAWMRFFFCAAPSLIYRCCPRRALRCAASLQRAWIIHLRYFTRACAVQVHSVRAPHKRARCLRFAFRTAAAHLLPAQHLYSGGRMFY